MEELQTPNDDAPETPPEPEPGKSRDTTKMLLGLVVALLVSILVVQFLQLQKSNDLGQEVAALTEDVTDLKPLRRDVDVLGDQLASLDRQVAAAVDASGASPAAIPTQGSDGSLPTFQDTANDPAVLGEMTLATIAGEEYYSGDEVTYAAEDGKARVWMIWAHWCPYCQAELPDMNTWWPENASRFPNVELVTISSAIDNSRSNPLLPYLDEEQFSFPVIVDETGAVSQLFGTSAFPFWVITDSDGKVVFRVAGALGIQSVDQIFSQLETMATET